MRADERCAEQRAATASGDGYDLEVTCAQVARAGLDAPWKVTVTNPDGFGRVVVVAVSGDYFDIFETQGFTPEPSATVGDATTLYLTLDAPGATSSRSTTTPTSGST